jgi:ribose transport system ATP-binding protein
VSDMALDLQGIHKVFSGVPAIRNVSLNLHKGHILGLIGQNGAGKSTLMNIIGGVVQPDTGDMLLEGRPYTPRNAADAQHNGIAFIHQELNLFTNLSIAENIFITGFPKRHLGPLTMIDRQTLKQKTARLLAQVDLKLVPETLVEQLSPGERQLVEIARALHIDARIIIFDEPTTSITARETRKLFELINQLREAGKTIIYISHILADVMTLADDIAVLRDGELVGAGTKNQFAISQMITLMVGRSIEQLYPPHSPSPTQTPVLEIKKLSEPGIVKDVDFKLYEGEILGLFGLMGSGRTELARMLFGLDGFASGEILIQRTSVNSLSPRSSINHRMAFVTENRREEGLFMDRAISENIVLTSLAQLAITPLQLLDDARLFAAAHQMATTLQIKGGAIDRHMAKSLSGGNQQKVVIAKWLLSQPTLFIMDEPTRGVDVGAKFEIYTIMNAIADRQGSILFISSELEELVAMCDRILVMSQGEIVGEFARDAFDKEQILRTAFREWATDV